MSPACGGLETAPTRPTLLRDATDATGATAAVVTGADCTTRRFFPSHEGTTLSVSNASLEVILSYPPVATLDVSKNRIDAVDFGGDALLQTLSLAENGIRSLSGFVFPPQLHTLDLGGNRLPSVAGLVLPESLQSLNLSACSLTSMRGVRLPWALEELDLSGNPLNEIEIRDANVRVLQRLKTNLPVIQNQRCSSANATLTVVRNTASVCVIPDDVFDALYAEPLTVSLQQDAPTTSSSNHDGLIIGLVVGGVALLVVFYFLYRFFCGKHNDKAKWSRQRSVHLDDEPSSGNFVVSSDMGERPLHFPMEYFQDDDVRFDAELAQFRIPKDEIRKKKVLARGGFGVVYLAKYRSLTVAVKQLQRDRMRYRTVEHFMKEIRLLANLNHPHIVGFLGLTWSTLHDLAIVLEYLPRGDLYTFLKEQRKKDAKASDFDWFYSSATMPAKSAIATDIANAFAYLHSLQTPIIHRDLKSRNVLLASDLRAKLTDFGISRTQSLEETMTREIGTVSWIAPEVLKGGRYSEKADIYSFGVVLTELDTCHSPYTIGFGPDAPKRTNTWIASRVSAGVLQPALLESCPTSVRELTLQCLQFEPDARPSAVEIRNALASMRQ